MSQIVVVVDDRERAVVPFLDDEFRDQVYQICRLTVGDFGIVARLVTGELRLLCAIERKELKDYASSLKEPRLEGQIKEYHKLREATGCQIFYCIEGPEFPAPQRKFARIPYSTIEASIDTLMCFHKFQIIRSRDQQHSAQRIYSLARAYARRVGELLRDGPGQSPGQALGQLLAAGGGAPSAMDALTAPRGPKSPAQAATEAWKSLKGVSLVTARILANAFSVADLVSGRVPEERLAGLRTATSRPLRPNVLSSLRVLARGADAAAARALELRILAALPGLSKKTAEALLAHARLRALASYSPEALSLVRIPQKNRTVKLGAKAAKILEALCYCGAGGGAPRAGEGQVLGGGTPAAAPATTAPAAPGGAPALPAGVLRISDARRADGIELDPKYVSELLEGFVC